MQVEREHRTIQRRIIQKAEGRPVRSRKATVGADTLQSLKGLVCGGIYGHGAKLPSERDLAEQLGVSRPSIREALRALAAMGVLETRHGSGAQVVETSVNLLKAPFEMFVLLEQPSVYELYEARELIEVFLAGRAAERRTEEDLAALKSALDEMRDNIQDVPSMTEANIRFHETLAAVAHQPVLESLMHCLQDGIRICIEATLPGVTHGQVTYEIHEEIYHAVKRRNPADAQRAMTIHMAKAIETLRRIEVEMAARKDEIEPASSPVLE